MATHSVEKENKEILKRRSRSQSDIVWQQFRKHKSALIGGIILIIMYTLTIFAGFLAPYGMNEYSRAFDARTPFHPPTKIHWRDADTGRFVRPYVYLTKKGRHPVTRQTTYEEDTSQVYPIQFMVHRPEATYKILGIWESDLHLFSVKEPARIFLWGTNNLGKDVFSRVLYGGQISLTIGLLAIWVSLFLGMFFGGLAGFYGGWVDDLIMRLIEIIDAIPGLFLLIVLATLLRDPKNPLAQAFGLEMTSSQIYLMIVIVLGFVGWGGLARTIRSMLLSLREQDYAYAAKALGASEASIIWKHLLPATASYLIVVITLGIPGYILGETGLSFIGLGPSELDSASWGMLLRDAQLKGVALRFSPWLLIPGIPIFIAVMCWNLLGDGLRDAFDPKKRT